MRTVLGLREGEEEDGLEIPEISETLAKALSDSDNEGELLNFNSDTDSDDEMGGNQFLNWVLAPKNHFHGQSGSAYTEWRRSISLIYNAARNELQDEDQLKRAPVA